MSNNFLTVQAKKFKLSGAGITSSATSLTLQSFTNSAGVSLATADFGSLGMLVLEPGTAQEETISFTTVVQNADGTATLSGITRGLGFIYPYTTLTANQKSHAGGTIAVLSNPSAFYYKFGAKDNDEIITGYWKVPDPVGLTDIANKQWVAALINGGAITTDKLLTTGTAGETVAAGKIVYLKALDGRWWLADADLTATIDNVQLGIAQGAGTAGSSITGGILLRGVDANQSGLTLGTKYYVSNTAGGISSSVGTLTRTVGNAASTTSLYFDPYFGEHPTGNQIAAMAGVAGTPSATNKFVNESALSGIIAPFGGRTAPTGWLICDGSAVSRATYPTLLSVIAPSATFTVTVASPAVFTSTAHGLAIGDRLHFTTTGALPTGLSTNTDYFVISAGLSADNFEVALTPGGVAINTSGSQSGTHTVYKSAWGKGDGSTTFNLPDLRSKFMVGYSASAPTTTLTFEPGAVSTGSDNVTILDSVFPSQGQLVRLTSSGTLPAGLSLATDYYIVRASATTIQFSTTQANANATSPVVVNITDTGTGVHTITFTNRAHTILGRHGGEETHGISIPELAAHTHTLTQNSGGNPGAAAGNINNNDVTGSTGGNALHNNMPPFVTLNYIIKT